MNVKIETSNAPKPNGMPYSQAIQNGKLVFTAGQVHLGADGKLVEGPIEEQTHQVMRNLNEVLKASGASFANVVKTTIYVTDMADYSKINQVYGSYFSEPFPARETVCVKALPLNARLEISMIAVKP